MLESLGYEPLAILRFLVCHNVLAGTSRLVHMLDVVRFACFPLPPWSSVRHGLWPVSLVGYEPHSGLLGAIVLHVEWDAQGAGSAAFIVLLRSC